MRFQISKNSILYGKIKIDSKDGTIMRFSNNKITLKEVIESINEYNYTNNDIHSIKDDKYEIKYLDGIWYKINKE